MDQRIAVYGGSFDPPTVGHAWMIEQGARLFDNLYVGIGVDPQKRYTFSSEERRAMLVDATSEFPNVIVQDIGNHFLIDFARQVGAGFILRGIRTESDYTYERAMRNVNGDLAPAIVSWFLMPPREIAEVSSSMVKGFVGPEGWEKVVGRYVPPFVFQKLKEKRGVS